MERKVLVSIIGHYDLPDGKVKSTIMSSTVDLFACPMGDLFQIIHVAIAEDKKVIIQPINTKSTMLLVSGSLLNKIGTGEP
jgi:hypothetical protein